MSRELDNETHSLIKQLCKEGDSLAKAGRLHEAVSKYEHALTYIPEPKYEWDAATWIHAAIGDALFLANDFQKAWAAFRDAMLCPNALDNPFIRLRRGQIFFELGDLSKAEQELAAAYMLGGEGIFSDAEKYADFIMPRLRKPEQQS